LEGRVERSLGRVFFRRRTGVEVGDDFFLLFIYERGITRRFGQSSNKGVVCSVNLIVSSRSPEEGNLPVKPYKSISGSPTSIPPSVLR
jgi:hypothetical protein